MNKLQISVLAFFVLLFGVLYFGFDTKPKERELINQERVKNAVQTDIRSLLATAREDLAPEQAALIGALEQAVITATADSMKTDFYKQLSSAWYKVDRPDIAGHYAQEIAKIENTDEAWSIAGTTYAIGAQRLEEDKLKSFSTEKAAAAFENAISINPGEVNHRINLAVTYVDNPPKENPMKGIQMLLNLDKKYPEAIGVQTTLARFAIKTGQFEKAKARLEKVISLEKDHKNANCLLAQAYEGLGKMTLADKYRQRCEALK